MLAACFMVTSVTLTILAGTGREPSSIFDGLGNEELTPLAPLPAEEAPSEEPSAPSVPVQ